MKALSPSRLTFARDSVAIDYSVLRLFVFYNSTPKKLPKRPAKLHYDPLVQGVHLLGLIFKEERDPYS
jgi:hypothetical protein